MGRRIAVYQTSGGSSGGGVPIIGNVEWGPNFGGADGDQFTAGVNADISAVDLANTKTCGCNIDLFSVDTVYSKTCGCNIDLFSVDPTYLIDACGCTADLDNLALDYNKACGCNIDLFSVDGSYSKTGGVHLSGTVLGAPFWQSASTASIASSPDTSITINKPSGTVQGDLLVAFIDCASTSSGAQPDTAPSGWTSSFLAGPVTGGAQIMYTLLWWKIAGSSEPSTYTFGVSASANTLAGEIHRLNGTDPTFPLNAGTWGQVAATGLTPDPVNVSITTTTTNCLVFAHLFHSHLALSQSHTAPASHIEATDFETTVPITTLYGITTDYRVFAAAGATGTATHNCTETVATDALYYRIAIRPGTLTIAT